MRIHFIAIGGSAMHNLAIALHKKGYQVTGSDDMIFEPASSNLARFGLLPEVVGWFPEKITPELDAVILGMHAKVENPELLKAQELGIRVYSYPEFIFSQSQDKLRVVIGGSHGKTTITSMILHVLNHYSMAFDYLVGAQLAGFDTMVQLSDAPLIIIEGDEYLASPIDRRPKFHLYQGNIGVISGIAWDHINVFKTFDDYVWQFRKFIDTLVPGSPLIYSADDAVVVQVVAQTTADVRRLPYTVPEHDVRDGVTYLMPGNTPLHIFGKHNLMNLNAAKEVCAQLGIESEKFDAAISSFNGAARRLELLFESGNTHVYKDFAHSPSKLVATIEAVKGQFPNRSLVACIELHTFSSLNKEFLSQYAGTMTSADIKIVFIDVKTFLHKQMTPFNQNDVRLAFNDKELLFFDNKDALNDYLNELDFKDKNLLLMSSGNFDGLDLVKLARELKI